MIKDNKMKDWAKRRKPEQIEPKPWLAEDAIKYFQSLLTPDMVVVEFGGGGSTLWLSERVKEVYAVERNDEWVSVIEKKVKQNVTLCTALSLMERADLLFIDGEPVQERGWWLDNARLYVKEGGIVVLDNANRPEYSGARAEFAKGAELLHTVRTEGGSYFVTEFWKCK